MTGPKTNEREGTRAVLRHCRMSASKARVVLDLIRGQDVTLAREILAGTSREAAEVIGKLLASAVANAVNNDGLAADELYVAAAYADEGPTMKRFSPRARGRAGRIRKRSTHITIIVARMDPARLERLRAARAAQAGASRARRVASSRRRADQQASLNRRESAAARRAEEEAANEVDLADEAVAEEAELSETDEMTEEVADVTEAPEAATGDEVADKEAGE